MGEWHGDEMDCDCLDGVVWCLDIEWIFGDGMGWDGDEQMLRG